MSEAIRETSVSTETAEKVDAHAAAHILQGAIDALVNQAG